MGDRMLGMWRETLASAEERVRVLLAILAGSYWMILCHVLLPRRKNVDPVSITCCLVVGCEVSFTTHHLCTKTR